MGASLAKMTRVWRVDTCSDGVEADLLGVQQLLQVGPDVLPPYISVGIVQKTALVLFYLSETNRYDKSPGPISSQQSWKTLLETQLRGFHSQLTYQAQFLT